MTIIAYRKGIMACDSCWANEAGGIDNLQNKISRLGNGTLYGGSGDADDRALVTLLDDPRCSLPSVDELREIKEDINALVVFLNGEIYYVDTGANASVCPVSLEFAAVGSGRSLAIGAMGNGASALNAVKVACLHNVHCRPPFHTLKLKLKKERGSTKR